jgi:hypothetical protein
MGAIGTAPIFATAFATVCEPEPMPELSDGLGAMRTFRPIQVR